MQTAFLVASLSPLWTWLLRLGGPGLILLGIADASLVPLPGSIDLFVVLLCAHSRVWWAYYAFMAMVGSVGGSYITYRMAEKSGKETVEKRLGKKRAGKLYDKFEKGGFPAVLVGCLLPPPIPFTPLLTVAGVMQYPRRQFLSALVAGRGLRFFALAFLGRSYGSQMIGFFNKYYRPVVYVLIALAAIAALCALLYFKWYRPRAQREERRRGEKVRDFPIPGSHQT